MQMTNEELAIRIENGEPELMTDLYNNCRRLLGMVALRYYNQYPSRCAECGIEITDLINESYFALPAAVKAYCASDREYKFTAFLRYPLAKIFNQLLGFRTKQGQAEPLNHCRRLDEPVPGADDLTYGDMVEDISAAEIYEEVEKRADFATLYEEMEKLSDKEQDVLKRHYFENETFSNIARSDGVSNNAIQQHKVKALQKLRKSKRMIDCYRADYGVLAYRHVGHSEFSRTWTSSTEWAALKAMPNELLQNTTFDGGDSLDG